MTEAKSNNTDQPVNYITLPGSAFFDQELGDVVYNKLMKAPVKDVQVLLWLSKLWKTINDIAHELAGKRDEIAKEVGLNEYVDWTKEMTPEVMSSEEYQNKSKEFGQKLQKAVFDKPYSLEPLWPLTLDLTNPDWHAKSFIENSNLSADDVMKLTESGIIILIDEKPAETQPVESDLSDKPTE